MGCGSENLEDVLLEHVYTVAKAKKTLMGVAVDIVHIDPAYAVALLKVIKELTKSVEGLLDQGKW